jgi:hypothetical protein
MEILSVRGLRFLQLNFRALKLSCPVSFEHFISLPNVVAQRNL